MLEHRHPSAGNIFLQAFLGHFFKTDFVILLFRVVNRAADVADGAAEVTILCVVAAEKLRVKIGVARLLIATLDYILKVNDITIAMKGINFTYAQSTLGPIQAHLQ